jgi:DNA-binding transcriptional MocR family regulator
VIGGRGAAAIAESIELAIHRGRIGSGEQLPTVRSLAAELGVSPVTVATAYRNLQQRGLVIGDGRRGTRVRGDDATPFLSATPMGEGVRDLAHGNPDPVLLPSLSRIARRLDLPPSLYGERASLPEVVELIQRQLRDDGVSGANIAVVAGALDGIERVLQANLRSGDRVMVEDPNFPRLLDLLRGLGLELVPVVCDDRGPLPDALEQGLRRPVRAALFTARAQNPTGAFISPERALEIRRVLEGQPDLLVIEDDYASGIAGVPLQTMTQDRARWVHVRSYSKSLGPDLRVGFLAGDETTIARVETRQRLGIGWVSHILQRLTYHLLSDGQTKRLRARAEETYTSRRDALLAGLAAHGIEAFGDSGLNVWIPVPEEASMVRALYESGWGVSAGERFRINTPPAIRVTISTLEPAEAEQVATLIAQRLHSKSLTQAG